VRAFASTRDGALWMGTNGDGLFRLFQGRLTRIGEAEGAPSNLIRSLYVDADGMLWIGTEGRGVARLDPRAWHQPGVDRRIAGIGVAHGLFDEVIHQILEDDQDRLWMSSNRGIFWVARSELNDVADGRAARVHSTSYTERDGIRNREANGGYQPAGLRARDGRLWFPTQDGVVFVQPADVGGRQLPPPVVIERVLAGDTSFLPYDAPLKLTVAQRDLQIEFTALSLLEPANVRIRYRLDPYDDHWVDAGNRRTAFYTRVPPGRYTFRVIASNNDDVWNEAGASLTLQMTPRFRETWAATALLLLGLLLLGGGGVRWRLRNHRVRERELTQLVETRTAALRRHERQLEAQNAQLAELHEARSRLFANLSHEFRTPLALILGPLRSLLDGRNGALDRSAREQHELMLRNGQRLLRLINQILELARLQAGAVALERRTHDLVGFARTATLAFAPLADRRVIALRFESELTEVAASFDAEQLEKVLLNLLSNALKFTDRGGAVTVSVGTEAGAAVIVVRDTGAGIPSEKLPHVFDRFYQADASATRRYEGTGIGLALAKELVELHGGEIRVESAPGTGSTFTVRLPLLPPVAGPVPPLRQREREERLPAPISSFSPPPEPEEGPGERAFGAGQPAPGAPGQDARAEPAEDRTTVLVVDDNPDMRAYLRSVLERSCRVIEAGDGRTGLERARERLPDLIVADVMMPELDGLALGRALKDDPMTDAIPVILLTARAAPEDQIAGFETGADAYLVKPFDPGVLEAQVAGLLAQRQRLRERFRQGEAAVPAPALAAVEPSALERRLRPLVETHLTDPGFGPDALAAAAGLSYHQLYRALHDELSTTPSRFIRGVRVECAAALLRQRAGSVTEIGYSVGFESLSYFHRAFRERFGTSPGEHLASSAPDPLA
jgi:signal transduction histidine kinase/AraC-like DNA-binding protein